MSLASVGLKLACCIQQELPWRGKGLAGVWYSCSVPEKHLQRRHWAAERGELRATIGIMNSQSYVAIAKKQTASSMFRCKQEKSLLA